ncbi:MAG: hypothetical protein GWN30_02110 [Gammaproteobacteria bacterium]|nr:hypothetical protein [Gammaproteobacteria bacterium]
MSLENIPLIVVILGFGIGGLVVLAGVFVIVFGRSDVGERLNRYVDQSADLQRGSRQSRSSRYSRFRYQLNQTLSMFDSEQFQNRLNSANWQITVTEYQLIRLVATILFFILGFVILQNIFAAIAIAGMAFVTPGAVLFRAVQSRQKKFQDQLIDSLTLIRGSVRAGSSFLQSLDVVVSEMAPPTSEEFRRVRREVELGLPLHQALSNLANRMQSDDLYLVVSAVTINMQVGGNLGQILEAVTETIRNRIYLFGEIRALTSYARYTSYLLTLLPFLTAFVLVLISPTYFDQLMEPGLTRYILIYAGISLVIGNIVLRRVAKIDV